MINPQLVAAARDFNRQLGQINWERHRNALLYALFNGGNLPPGYMTDTDSGHLDHHSALPSDVTPRADAARDLFLIAQPGLRPLCGNCRHRHSIHVRCSVHATNCGGCVTEDTP